ncbi:Phospholipase sgr2 [Dionaea muscipula]
MGIDGNQGDGDNERTILVPDGSRSIGVGEMFPELLKNTPSNIARLADEIEHCEGRQKYLAQTRSPSDGGDVRWYFCKVPSAVSVAIFLCYDPGMSKTHFVLERLGKRSMELPLASRSEAAEVGMHLLLGDHIVLTDKTIEDVHELSASIPRSEIVDKGAYFRFGMRDSLAIEASFLQREEVLLSYWWKEYAECSVGPSGPPSQSTMVDSWKNSQTFGLYEVEEERVGVPVKGGLYEVDLMKRHCFPVYWNGENRRVLRGHWFGQIGGLDWLPLREDIAEQLEFAYRRQVWHRRTFQPSGLFAARIDLHGSTVGLHALFIGEDDTWEAWLNIDAIGFSSVINFGGNGMKLRRGYAPSQSPKPTQDELRQQQEEAMDDYCSQVQIRILFSFLCLQLDRSLLTFV